MKNLILLKKNDIINFNYGYQRINARVLNNDGSHITFHSLDWEKRNAETFSYNKLKNRKVCFIGKYRPLYKKLLSLNFSEITFQNKK